MNSRVSDQWLYTIPTSKLPASTKTYFMTNPLNIIFDDFSI